MANVFLSHSCLDKPFVRLVGEDLEAAGIFVWFDEARLKIGDSLPLELGIAISSTDYVLAFLSHNSMGSPWVQKELAIAAALEINGQRVKVLPLRLDDSPVPAFLADKLYANFGSAVQYDFEFRRLLTAVKPDALPVDNHFFYCLTIGSTRKDRLLRSTTAPQMKEWVLDYLLGTIEQRDRSTERHFAYLALGEIGGERAEAQVEKGLADSDEFARKGARGAWKQLGH